MAWPAKVYVATKALGVYYTEDSLAPGAAQPVWATLNGGLPATAITAFCLDRSASPIDSRMFAVVGGALYRRTTGDWASILTAAEARAVAGFTLTERLLSVITDPVTGYVYAVLGREAVGIYAERLAVLRSYDHGDSWASTALYAGTGNNYNIGNVDAHHSVVVLGRVHFPTAGGRYYSLNDGATFAYATISSAAQLQLCSRIHPLETALWYGNEGLDLVRGTPADLTLLMAGQGHGPRSWGGLWLDPADADHLLVANQQIDTRIVESADGGTTAARDEEMSADYVYEIAEGCDEGYWVQGQAYPGAYVMSSTDGITLTAKNGTNAATPPYTDAIPNTCGGLAPRGLWVVGVDPGRWHVSNCKFTEVT